MKVHGGGGWIPVDLEAVAATLAALRPRRGAPDEAAVPDPRRSEPSAAAPLSPAADATPQPGG